MLTSELFEGLAFPYRVQDKTSGILLIYSNEVFFDLPHYRTDHSAFWKKITTEGWHICPDGYGVFSCLIAPGANELLIIHGLKINGLSKAQGRSSGLSIKVERSKIEEYIRSFLAAIEKTNRHFGSMLAESIHEIRGVNTALYHVGYELQNNLLGQGRDAALAKNITSLSELISERMNLIDLLATQQQIEELNKETVCVFKKFDKLVRCFMVLAKKRNITLQLSGISRGTVKANSHFELIPLLLLDNAVKYSPDNKEISVSFIETTTEIACYITSVGPLVTEEESDKIFFQGVRGEYAKKSGSSGSGIGLYFLRNLVHSAGGEITFQQEKQISANIKGIPYRNTEFKLTFPISPG